MEKMLSSICILCMTITALLYLFKKSNQPNIIAYILTGIFLGPNVLGLLSLSKDVKEVGDIGVLLLMFFLGLELKVPDKSNLIKQPIYFQFSKTIIAIALSFCIGSILGYSSNEKLLIASFLMFNSTVIASEYLKRDGNLHTNLGSCLLNILLLQDILFTPFLLYVDIGNVSLRYLFKILMSIVGITIFLYVINRLRERKKNFLDAILPDMVNDHELQVFSGLLLCLGFAYLSSFSGLGHSTGSFLAGVIVGRSNSLTWLEKSLRPFEIFFVSLFFVSIGLQIDIHFLLNHLKIISFLSIIFILCNFIFAVLFFCLNHLSLSKCIYNAALLSHCGELAIVAFSLGFQKKTIDYDFYMNGLCLVAISLLVSSYWIFILKYFLSKNKIPLNKLDLL
ncbi:cation:proton antiporter [Rhizosphaericola mali]|uniref:Cation:proton antiporter n=1 Tax=Rhizosphaericola mali TaxID=2545455 RepID=A0A5P2G3C5_9BACT|nr:cation:proton antiporter [Rhizosphaericola mali]QES90316.1 cation:proton antiporter [Rhizosphaericola mali]